MQKVRPAANPDEYLASLSGWQHACATKLRRTISSVEGLTETIKWGHLVYSSNGPVLLVRAEPTRMLLGFWRGQRLTGVEPRLRAGGKYEMATVELHEDDAIAATIVRRLATEAVALNETLGDPTADARPSRKGRSGK